MSTAVDDAVLVHIAVRKVGQTYELGIFPSRSGETVAFRTLPPNNRLRERPREVVWEGHDIPPNMKLRIAVKDGIPDEDKRLLPHQVYEITDNNSPVKSGPVLLKPSNTGGTWKYSIFLVDSAATTNAPNYASLDPDVDIHPDP